jgi:hypothetical protein
MLARSQTPQLYSRADCQGFHCDDAGHARQLHRLCQLDEHMHWNCCGAALPNAGGPLPDPLRALVAELEARDRARLAHTDSTAVSNERDPSSE